MRCQTCRRQPSSVCSNHRVNFFLCTATTCLARDRGKPMASANKFADTGLARSSEEERFARRRRMSCGISGHARKTWTNVRLILQILAWTDLTANRSSMMSDTVWISLAMGSGTNVRRLWDSFRETETRQYSIAWGEQNDAGEPLKAESFPAEIYGAPSATESDYRLPDIFHAGSFWVVSKAAANVLRQFDLGAGGLYPVKVFKKDRQTALGDEWFCINFGNRKETVFVPESSTFMREHYIRPGGVKGWVPK